MLDNPSPRPDPTLDFDHLGPSGDVISARNFSQTLLQGLEGSSEQTAMARLILTATCLHMEASIRLDPCADHLRSMLIQIEHGQRIGLEGSPMQFVQYVACEIAELNPVTLKASLSLAMSALAPYANE